MPVDKKLENWNKENYPITAIPISPERPSLVKYTQPRIVLKSLEKAKYWIQSDEEDVIAPKQKSPLKQAMHPTRKVAKRLFSAQN